jgi:hypothetical protein
MQVITSSLLFMAFVLIIVLSVFAFFVYSPAHLLAKNIKAKQQGVEAHQISDDEAWVLTWVICVPVYLVLWWLLTVTGLGELISKEFK